MNSGTYEIARRLIASALGAQLEAIGPTTAIYKIPEWDSLGQLKIVVALEKALNVRILDEVTFESLVNVRRIAAYINNVRAENHNGK
ncbi:MAG: acyl carrier protein [Myxococcales bacterium]|nr:acyl carrier protein [Myxococcales bacterium]